MDGKQFTEICRYLMMRRGLNLKSFAESLNVNYTYFVRLFNGERQPSKKYIEIVKDWAKREKIDLELAKEILGMKADEAPTQIQNQLQEPLTDYKAAQNKFASPAMMDGTELEILATLRVKNDVITSYKFDIKRIS